MFFLANGLQPAGPSDKLCASEEPNEAKQAYPRRDGRQRPGSTDLGRSGKYVLRSFPMEGERS